MAVNCSVVLSGTCASIASNLGMVNPPVELGTPPSHLLGERLTNINVDLWNRLLKGYPDRDFVVKGLKEGFSLGFIGEAVTIKGKNAKSVRENLSATKEKVQKELQLGRLEGPFSVPPFEVYKCSPLSLREKSMPGKFRLLHDLSLQVWRDDTVTPHISCPGG